MGVVNSRTTAIGLVALFGLFVMSCGSDELSIGDSASGLNGGFETTEHGYPVNWAFFPNPETDSALQVVLDSEDVAEGAHSLKVVVGPSEVLPAIRSRRIPVQPGRDYRLAMSVKNEGCDIQVNRIVQGPHGKTVHRRDMIISTSASLPEWETFEEILSVAPDEGNVVLVVMLGASGTVWLDDVRVEEVAG